MPHPKYPHVFDPIQLGPIILKNRIVGNPMMTGLSTPRGMVTDAMVAHIGARARTGAGMIIIGDSAIDYNYAVTHYTPLDLGNEENLAGLTLLAEEAHRYGCKLGVELQHGGALAHEAINRTGARISPSPSPGGFFRFKKDAIIMDRAIMDSVIQSYADASERLMRAGFDEVLVHCGHGWLISQFLNARINKRTDEYGGSLENRMRFPLEVLKTVHDTVGRKMAVDMRVSVGGPRSPYTETDLEEMIAFIRAAAPYVTSANISVSTAEYFESSEYMCQSYYLPHLVNTDWCARARAAGLPMPVMATGSIVTTAEAEEIIASGKADMVGIGRGTLVDHEHFEKDFRGREDDVRPCLRCAHCTDRLFRFLPIRCAVNPTCGRDERYPRVTSALKKKSVAVIGGGPAGMQCAQTLVQRGHNVTLYERSGRLGGMLHVAAALPDKYDMRRYTEWQIKQTLKCGAKIVLNTEAAPELIKKEAPDALVVAIGGKPASPPIPGLSEYAAPVNDVDTRAIGTGKRVAILGAAFSGSECAIELLREGKEVTLVDMISKETYDMFNMGSQVWLSIQRLHRELGAKLIFNSRVTEITGKGVAYESAEGGGFIECDTVVNALGVTLERDKINELLLSCGESYAIGDCLGED
ncbi:MAG: FAD-dependent oxidoreductase, partial [Oscillospiraceae bacterium]|nr:FAD-dependent oxidoreductase [Oscillospiraceae bacterium]